MKDETSRENFNPISLKIIDYKTAEEYKNDFFVKNIVDTVEYYELAILNSYFIYPFLSLKAISQAYSELYKSDKSEITYRKVNDWSSKGLFEDNRTSNIQWRKYSVNTGIKLLLINDLKRFGYSNEQIKSILTQICEDSCSILVKNKKFNYKYFDFYASVFYKKGINFLIMIDNDCNAFYLTEKDLAINIVEGLENAKPYLILPFSKYLSVFAKYIFHRENETVIEKLLSLNIPNEKEQTIIEKVRNKENKEIKIENKCRHGKSSTVIKTTKIKDNVKLTSYELEELIKNNEHQRVSASISKNNTYNLKIEETEKLD